MHTLSCFASSEYDDFSGCNKAYDNNIETSWLPEEAGIGSWIHIQFQEVHFLSKIELRQSYGGNTELSSIKGVQIQLSPSPGAVGNISKHAILAIDNGSEWNAIDMSPLSIETQSVRISIISSYTSSPYTQGFSEIRFYGSV